MINNNLVKLAKQGNIQAIATLIEDNLDREKIVKYELKDSYLKLILEADRVPDRQKLVPLIHKIITNLETNSITKIIIYGQKTGETFPEWNQKVEIDITSSQEQLSDLESNLERETSIQKVNKNEFIEALQTFRFASVVPCKQVLDPDLYRSNLVKLLLFFGLFPLAISSFYSNNSSLKDIRAISFLSARE